MSRCILIVGTQRSGTSLTAGIVHKLGVDFPGTMLDPSEHNPKGYFEAAESNAALDLMLAQPDDERPRWRDPVGADLADWLDQNREQSEWGWKDPRFIYASPPILRWLEARGVSVIPIIVKRDLMATARSFAKYGHDIQKSIDAVEGWQQALLWTEGVLERYCPLIIAFDEIIEEPEESVERIAQYIGRPSTTEAVEHVDPSLRRNG